MTFFLDFNLSQVLVEHQTHRLLVRHQVDFRSHQQGRQIRLASVLPHQLGFGPQRLHLFLHVEVVPPTLA